MSRYYSPHELRVKELVGSCRGEFVPDADLDRRCRAHRRALARRGVALEEAARRSALDAVRDAILLEYLDGVVVDGRLSKREREALLLRLAGLSFVEIGLEMGGTKQNAHKLVCRGVKKVLRAMDGDRCCGWWDVYRSEVSRQG